LRDPNPLRSGYASILFAILIWAVWILTTRFLSTGALNAYDISALRFIVAGLVLLPVAWKRGLKVGPYGWRSSLLLCFFLGPSYAIVCATGMQHAPASHAAAIVNGFMVLTSTLLGVYWLKEPFSHQKKVGIAILFAGMGCVAYAKTGGSASIGHLFFAIGGVMWASYGVSLRRWKISAWHATSVTSVLSAILYLPIYYFFLPQTVQGAPWSLLIFHSFYQGVMTAVVALFLYGKAVHTLGASTAAAFVPLVPVITLLLGIPFLGEIPGPLEVVGVALVFFGLLVVVVKLPGRRAKGVPIPTLT
jgi:drug/metabolite transporter (DMT)-like permease